MQNADSSKSLFKAAIRTFGSRSQELVVDEEE